MPYSPSITSLVLRVGETVDNAERARRLERGDTSRDYVYNYTDDYDVPLTANGYRQMREKRGMIWNWAAESGVSHLLVVQSPSDRAECSYQQIFGNRPFVALSRLTDENMRVQNVGIWNGLSREQREKDEENYRQFIEFGPYYGVPPGGESKASVVWRVGKVIQKAEEQAKAQGIKAILYIADSSEVTRIFVSALMKCDLSHLPEPLIGALYKVIPTERQFEILHQGDQVIPPAEAARRAAAQIRNQESVINKEGCSLEP